MCKCKSPEELRMLTLTNEVMSIRDNLVGLRLDLAKVVKQPDEMVAFHPADDNEVEEVRELLDSLEILANPNDHGAVLLIEVENAIMYIEMLLEEAFIMEV